MKWFFIIAILLKCSVPLRCDNYSDQVLNKTHKVEIQRSAESFSPLEPHYVNHKDNLDAPEGNGRFLDHFLTQHLRQNYDFSVKLKASHVIGEETFAMEDEIHLTVSPFTSDTVLVNAHYSNEEKYANSSIAHMLIDEQSENDENITMDSIVFLINSNGKVILPQDKPTASVNLVKLLAKVLIYNWRSHQMGEFGTFESSERSLKGHCRLNREVKSIKNITEIRFVTKSCPELKFRSDSIGNVSKIHTKHEISYGFEGEKDSSLLKYSIISIEDEWQLQDSFNLISKLDVSLSAIKNGISDAAKAMIFMDKHLDLEVNRCAKNVLRDFCHVTPRNLSNSSLFVAGLRFSGEEKDIVSVLQISQTDNSRLSVICNVDYNYFGRTLKIVNLFLWRDGRMRGSDVGVKDAMLAVKSQDANSLTDLTALLLVFLDPFHQMLFSATVGLYTLLHFNVNLIEEMRNKSVKELRTFEDAPLTICETITEILSENSQGDLIVLQKRHFMFVNYSIDLVNLIGNVNSSVVVSDVREFHLSKYDEDKYFMTHLNGNMTFSIGANLQKNITFGVEFMQDDILPEIEPLTSEKIQEDSFSMHGSVPSLEDYKYSQLGSVFTLAKTRFELLDLLLFGPALEDC
ncbi:uncharacterized protein LOC132263402 [Phlebotomus argentipes]|uniref:uncharacterized protein LOC132263402 n=1 Tax=Phlebotomus argentipes TaxID=94469 RepID=UPI002892F72A|nr:uncharacterized protein LOC132263402 [Phlebotomus argentipes]